MPNVQIGSNVIIGAGSVVASNIPDNSVAVGNPAKVVARTSDYIVKHRKLMDIRPIYDESWTVRSAVSSENKKKISEALMDGIGYIE